MAEQAKAFRRVPLQAESVIPLDPDLVLVAPSFRVVTQPMLKALGFNVVEVGLINDLAAGRAQIREFAALLGHPERGEKLIADIDAARDGWPRRRGQRAATALLIANGGYTVGPDSLAASLMRRGRARRRRRRAQGLRRHRAARKADRACVRIIS